MERGHNRQYSPHFRSDMHGEMDLLNRYEDRVQKKGGGKSSNDPRQCGELILFTSTEPCPMCLTRIIQLRHPAHVLHQPRSGRGMAVRMDQLPPFWRCSWPRFSPGRVFAIVAEDRRGPVSPFGAFVCREKGVMFWGWWAQDKGRAFQEGIGAPKMEVWNCETRIFRCVVFVEENIP
ncbi:MAG: hypothetical protein R2864_00800 [Syntrophotaleaceae bacterium]